MDWATRTNHAAPETKAARSPIQAVHASHLRKTAGACAPAFALENAGSAMKAPKKTAPAATRVAAKWMARTQISRTCILRCLDHRRCGAHGLPTWKEKFPSVLCVSTESACQRT